MWSHARQPFVIPAPSWERGDPVICRFPSGFTIELES
jgi:hypothetical protein